MVRVMYLATGSNVQNRITYAAKQEFLKYGFKDALLRRIASSVGMTTGAINTYFRDKQALFDEVVIPVIKQVGDVFNELSKSYYSDDNILSEITYERTIVDLIVVYDFIYRNLEVFRILLLGASGSKHADFIHDLVNHEVRYTQSYLKKLDIKCTYGMHLNILVIHTISEGYINAILEPVRHGRSLQEAIGNLDFIVTFYTRGWLNAFGRCYHG
jgi:AcrR family transcriptional regulator